MSFKTSPPSRDGCGAYRFASSPWDPKGIIVGNRNDAVHLHMFGDR
jgi:hypothetical protein